MLALLSPVGFTVWEKTSKDGDCCFELSRIQMAVKCVIQNGRVTTGCQKPYSFSLLFTTPDDLTSLKHYWHIYNLVLLTLQAWHGHTGQLPEPSRAAWQSYFILENFSIFHFWLEFAGLTWFTLCNWKLRYWKSCAGKMCLYTWVTENEQGAPIICRDIGEQEEFCKWLERLFPDAMHWRALECIHHCRQAASPSWEATNRRCDRGQMHVVWTFCVAILFDSNDSMFHDWNGRHIMISKASGRVENCVAAVFFCLSTLNRKLIVESLTGSVRFWCCWGVPAWRFKDAQPRHQRSLTLLDFCHDVAGLSLHGWNW